MALVGLENKSRVTLPRGTSRNAIRIPHQSARYQLDTELARPKRFELLTPRFVVWCSIQLSYGRLPTNSCPVACNASGLNAFRRSFSHRSTSSSVLAREYQELELPMLWVLSV